MRLLQRLLLLIVVVGLGFVAVLVVVYKTAPRHKGSEKHFDTLIVLGTPSKLDGSPSLEMAERVDEAVREYRAGVAPHIIMTGAAAHNQFIEAQVMADDAVQQGVPRDAVMVEGQAKDTIQNIWYSHQIMQANGWHSAEVISSPYHLPRTGLILTHYDGPLAFDWRTHASRWPPAYSVVGKVSKRYHEALGLVKLRVEGFRHSPFLPNP
jgi:uncharacterized SAM-binding protein YcdF (DUF218 family)